MVFARVADGKVGAADMKDDAVAALDFPDVVFIANVGNKDIPIRGVVVVGVVKETGEKVGTHSLHGEFGDGLKDLAWGNVPPGVDAFFFGTFDLMVGETEQSSGRVFDGGGQADDLELIGRIQFLNETGDGVFAGA